MRFFTGKICSLLIAFLACSAPIAAQQVGIIQRPLPTNDGIGDLTSGPENAIWFSSANGNSIASMTAAGVVTQHPLPPGDSADGITYGPDGALWFADFDTDSIGRLTVSGLVTEYPVPSGGPGAGPVGITTGPDGALWFTEQSANKIGRITNSGEITEYAVPIPNAAPSIITTGPDGALWFTQLNDLMSLGRVTTAGIFTEYLIGFPIGDITTGPDGALWCTTAGGLGLILRVTDTGVVTQFQSDTYGPNWITSGPGGALWFTAVDFMGVNQIGRITTAGIVTVYPVPAVNANSSVIVTGPNHALWFAESGVASIGEVISADAALSLSPDTGVFGTETTLTGGGFQPNEHVNLFAAASTGNDFLAAIVADASGAFSFSHQVGALSNGDHSIFGVGQNSAKIGVGQFTAAPSLVLSPTAGVIGSPATASGYGFRPGYEIDVSWDVYILGATIADGTGSFVLNFTVPKYAGPGSYVVQANQGDYLLAQANFQVN